MKSPWTSSVLAFEQHLTEDLDHRLHLPKRRPLLRIAYTDLYLNVFAAMKIRMTLLLFTTCICYV